jgi:hypothetical protein
MYSVAQRSAGPEPAADLLTILAQAHNFSLTALAANRAGRLALEQIAFLRQRARRTLLVGLLVVAGALPFAAGMAIVEGGPTLASVLLFGGITALAGRRWVVRSVRTLNDARAGAVAMLEGVVTKGRTVDIDVSGNSTITYSYHVGRQQFQVSSAAYAALPPGLICRLYYSPGIKELLSVEPVAAPAAGPTREVI